MNELIKTIRRDDGTIAVSGRELHYFLEVDTPYTQWFDRMIDYGFTENTDFKGLSQKSEKPIGGRPRIDHVMTLDMAKEVAMIQRTNKGKQARQYFISVEKRYKQLAALPRTPEEKLALTMEVANRSAEKVMKLDNRVTDLEKNAPIAPGEYSYISRQVRNVVESYINTHHLRITQKQRGLLYKDVSRGMNEYVGIKTRTQLRKRDFDRADEFVSNWHPSTATMMLIRETQDDQQNVSDQLAMG
ncbi:antA/AntB antirepressor family protein [Lacticaseibacillus rhamnosus]|uniref:antA/AntB antirepressor family protein n=1 Tax=Lacticaseibacillus rhamnosus TaxID=47715 RepID=UPI000235A27B|nr:antA/AntB antirepressor family protein [Lacticaseibacillus rhamnosus]AGP70873.1 Phage anti-repressor protein [Lacticaseibacillus rhamnosus LOCK900]EHJ20796.1 phage bIL285 ORF6 [Lacticaseibacillus rhamnosus R0011]EHJ31964.1 toxin-antitoxin system, toxin component, Bro domain protein [Lacticaseibacillus rhamnosus ATCC 21052]KIX27688.1 toxin Bro [Lacticaseibacillus rhamnosus]KMO61594.1 toxin Bro [Lacticaseibacillus rhamnosus]